MDNIVAEETLRKFLDAYENIVQTVTIQIITRKRKGDKWKN
jgi:hypothetical protein